MKLSIIAAAFLIILLSASSKSEAAPWRGYHRHGWYRPHAVISVYTPPVRVYERPVVVGGGGYYRGYYGRPYRGHRYYEHEHHGEYGHRYERH